ncbi:MAG TPA: site-specific integrase [Pyrinomonadaceae bacterium]|nr:site-specific integrase [Pyrinomonadaceae bacterium]
MAELTNSQDSQTALMTVIDGGTDLRAALRNALSLWADATTDATTRRRVELLKAKPKVIEDFFSFVEKHPGEASPEDVKRWQRMLEERLRPATVYVRISLLSSFYEWMMRDPALGRFVQSNPARLARPRAPKPYQTESVKSFTDDELVALVEHVRVLAAGDDNLVAKRDYTLLRLYVATGWRREEVISLRGSNVKVTDCLIVSGRAKGGHYHAKEVRDPEVKDALFDYLTAAGRLHVLKTDAPLWTRHDNRKLSGEQLTSHAFTRNLKLYARSAGLGDVHLHQTRHTYARIVSEETGSISATQDALDHRNRATTSHYVQRISIKRDLYSEGIAERLKRREDRGESRGPGERFK